MVGKEVTDDIEHEDFKEEESQYESREEEEVEKCETMMICMMRKWMKRLRKKCWRNISKKGRVTKRVEQ